MSPLALYMPYLKLTYLPVVMETEAETGESPESPSGVCRARTSSLVQKEYSEY